MQNKSFFLNENLYINITFAVAADRFVAPIKVGEESPGNIEHHIS